MNPHLPLAPRRLAAMRDAIDEAADTHGLPLTVRQVRLLADVITRTLYPDQGRPDPALTICWRTNTRRTGQELSDIELICLRYVVAGLTNAEIADRINRVENRVRVHLRNAYAKLGARNRAHAAALYCISNLYQAGDVPTPERQA